MRKLNLGLSIVALLGVLVFPKISMANEGIVLLRGAGTSGSCFAASVFVDGTYRILATCRDLKTALSPEQNRYVVWSTGETGKTRRIGEIVNGKLATGTDTKFTSLFVTAESDGYGSKPSDSILLSGVVQAINFATGEVKQDASVTIAPTPTPEKAIKATPTKTTGAKVTPEATVGQGIGGALSTVLKIALFGFGALLLIVGVFSFISRKRAL
ncbi:MAG: hypothetical protein WA052_04225 [Microgenomates group bacterium]